MTSAASNKPLIGLPGRRKRAADVKGLPDSLSELSVDMYYVGYAEAVAGAGGIPLHLPTDVDAAEIIPRLDGLLLTGGADIEPHHYGQDPDGNGEYDPGRDPTEFALYAHAIEAGIPVLGICRGIQVMNVQMGGTLIQHLPKHACYEGDPSEPAHEVTVEPDSILAGLYGEVIKVNSLHHQAIDTLAGELRAVGHDHEGLVEAVEDADRCLLGVQWHPEMHRQHEPIFDWLVETSIARSGR